MNEITPTVSAQTLIKASLSALVLAFIASTFFILPAEYNIDITGFGKSAGLTQLAAPQTKQTRPEVALDSTQALEFQTDEITIEIAAKSELEYKFFMQKHGKMSYYWNTDGQPIYFDLHGEPDGDTSGYFESYAISSADKVEGSYTTPFAGTHGWYWRNDSNTSIKVTLKTQGYYQLVGIKK